MFEVVVAVPTCETVPTVVSYPHLRSDYVQVMVTVAFQVWELVLVPGVALP